MSDAFEDQIRLGLQLVAEDVQPRARPVLGPSLRIVAFAVVGAAVAAAVLLGIVSRGGGRPAAHFLTDRFDYRPGGGFAGGAHPLKQIGRASCRERV